MSQKYAQSRISQALKDCHGNHAVLQRKILAWAYEDHKFLLGLVQPHLKGIAAYAVGYAARQERRAAAAAPADIPHAGAGAQDDAFGKEILKAIAAGGAAQFGQADALPRQRKSAASRRHIESIRTLAGHAESDTGKDKK